MSTINQDELMRQLFTRNEVKEVLRAMDDYASGMERRAQANDAEDTLCECSHPWSFHVDPTLRPQPCDFEIGDELCGCREFKEKP